MRHHLLMSTAALLVLSASPAIAQSVPADDTQDSADQLDEIVVTAQKREENIQTVPLSIMSVSGATLAQASVNDPTALQKLVPSLQINNTLFGSGVVIRIRGFGSAANTAVDSEVASYIDGAYVPRPGSLLTSFLDVKNVEVLNGPQGTLFGRNAAMGAISINTNAPSTTATTLALSAEAGRFGTYSGTAVANIPASDMFAVRFAIKGSQTDGLYHNLLDGKTYGERSGLVARISTKAEFAPNVTWILRGDYTRTDGDGVFPQAVYTTTADPAAITAFSSFITRNGGSLPVYSDNPSYTFNSFFPNPFAHDRQYGITSDMRWGVTSNVDLRLINNYRNWRNEQLAGDTVATSLDLLSVNTLTNSKEQSHELQLVSAKDAFLGSKLGLTAGLYYAREEYSLATTFNMGTQFCPVILSRAGPIAIAGCRAQPQAGAGKVNFGQVAKSYAVYVQGDYQIAPNLSLALGARHTWDRKQGNFAANRINSFLSAILITDSAPGLTFRDSNTSVRASLSWNVTDKVLAFATFSTGYKSGGFNSGGSSVLLSPAVRTFASETVRDFELGFKSTLFDGKARFNVTLFNTDLRNFQDRSFNGTGFVIRNSGDVRSRGFDMDGEFLLAPRFKVTFGGTYLDSKYTNNTFAPGLEGCTGLPGCPTVQNLTGKRLAFAPEWQGNVGADWKSQPITGGVSLGLGANIHFTSSFLTANSLNPQSRVPGYATTDLRLSLISEGNTWKLDLFGNNVFDKHYYVTTVAQTLGAAMGINNTATGTTIFRGFLGSPATYGVRISTNF